ncbi:MAG: Hsp20/alpha crystallin family protein [Nannocystaceae bacterium]
MPQRKEAMFTYWMNANDSLRVLDEVRRQLDHAFRDFDRNRAFVPQRQRATWPELHFHDRGAFYEVRALVPGLKQEDLEITATPESITVSGARKAGKPEGKVTHRRERSSYRFTRTFDLPGKIDVEAVGASLKNGVLTLKLPRVPEELPKKIRVKISGTQPSN